MGPKWATSPSLIHRSGSPPGVRRSIKETKSTETLNRARVMVRSGRTAGSLGFPRGSDLFVRQPRQRTARSHSQVGKKAQVADLQQFASFCISEGCPDRMWPSAGFEWYGFGNRRMRIDHHAYQRATRVAAFGVVLQLAIGLCLLLFGMLSGDHAIRFAAGYALLGLFVWVSLLLVFYQHKMERLEALEEDELSATHGGSTSAFDQDDEIRVAARRLKNMHKWLMPGVSLLLAALLAVLAWVTISYMLDVSEGEETFLVTNERGWAIAMALGFSIISFIFSRFVAGMSKQEAWQNLRGGSSYMVGNALVLLAVAAGLAFAYFDNMTVMKGVAVAIGGFMGIFTLEICFNFLLNLYRPRIPGEVPRPAFDSKLLSLFAAPDSIVRSINEAVNYQFGFDITSSWGYRLLVRSLLALIGIGTAVMFLLSTIAIVEPHQQALRFSGGKIVEDKIHSETMWKIPWPFETAGVYDVTRVRTINLTAQERLDFRRITLFSYDLNTVEEIQPFIVGASQLGDGSLDARLPAALIAEIEADRVEEDDEVRQITRNHSLVDAIITMQYRIKSTKTGSDSDGLIDYLSFAPDTRKPRDELTERQHILKQLALREISLEMSQRTIDEVLATDRLELGNLFKDAVQQSFDEHKTGVEIVSINILNIRPHGEGADQSIWVDLMMAKQDRQSLISRDAGRADLLLATLAGSVRNAERILAEIETHDQMREKLNINDPAVVAQRVKITDMLVKSRGAAAQIIANAERDRWVEYMSKRVQALRVQGEQKVYRASPAIYRQRELMNILASVLPGKRKFLIGIDPATLDLDVEIKQTESVFSGLSEALDQSFQGGSQ